jgi:CHAT domain-containing protein/tetratricopeptide (TPR) repeat protein
MPGTSRFARTVGACVLTWLAAASAGGPAAGATQETAGERLAAALVAAATAEERRALLDGDPPAVTAELRGLLQKRGEERAGRSEHRAALAHFEAAAEVAGRLDNAIGVIVALQESGNVYRRLGEYDRALERHRQAFARSEAIGHKGWMAASANGSANVHSQRGEDDLAVEGYELSLRLSEELKLQRGVASSLANLGSVHVRRGDFVAANDFLSRARAASEALGDEAGVAQADHVVGVVRRTIGDFEGAVAHLERALAVRERRGDRSSTAATLNSLGTVYRLQGDYGRALALYERSLALREALGEPSGVADALHELGLVCQAQGDLARARDLVSRSLLIFEKLASKAKSATVMADLAAIHLELGEPDAARAQIERALALDAQAPSRVRAAAIARQMGEGLRVQGRLEPAHAAFTRALAASEAAGDPVGTAAALHALARLERARGNHAAAGDALERAVEIARRVHDRERTWQALTDLAAVHRARQESARARATLEDAITIVEDLRDEVAGGDIEQQRTFERRVAPYVALVDLLADEGDAVQVLRAAERAKARVLLDAQQGRGDPAGILSSADRETEWQLRARLATANVRRAREARRARPDARRLAALDGEREAVRRDYADWRSRLLARYPSLRAAGGGTPAFTFDAAARLVPDGATAIVEFVATETRLLMLVVARKAGAAATAVPEVTLHRIPLTREALRARVRPYVDMMAARDLRVLREASALHALLLGPGDVRVTRARRLVIVPDDALWELPFQTLQSAAGRFVVETAAISYAPSIAALGVGPRGPRSVRAEGAVFALGNPALAGGTGGAPGTRGPVWPAPLPHAEREAREVARLYAGDSARAYVGAEATEDLLRQEAGRHRLLHLATHGVVDDRSPMHSHVLLARGASAADDGQLEAWEILSLTLDADLVVLSACESGRGRVAPGEGLIGLSWALAVAGARSTVVSQWKVDSASTTALMLAFHRERRRGASTAQALRLAAERLRATPEYRHPFYWGAFVAIGPADGP